MRSADYGQICEWVISVWDSVSTDIICISFKSSGISTSLDGSEDFLINCFKKGNPCEKVLVCCRNLFWKLLPKNKWSARLKMRIILLMKVIF